MRDSSPSGSNKLFRGNHGERNFISAALAGSSQSRSSSSGGAPPAIYQPFNAPTDVPTTMSGEILRLRAFHTPAWYAPNMPPPDRTSPRRMSDVGFRISGEGCSFPDGTLPDGKAKSEIGDPRLLICDNGSIG